MVYWVIWYWILDWMVLCMVIRKTMPRVMRNHFTGFSKPYDTVFNIILRRFCYHMVAYYANNKCYRRS